MSDDERNPWPMVIFFALALVVLWLIMDTLKAPSGVKVTTAGAGDDGTGAAVTVTAAAGVSATAETTPGS
jgi:hypothetical protein